MQRFYFTILAVVSLFLPFSAELHANWGEGGNGGVGARFYHGSKVYVFDQVEQALNALDYPIEIVSQDYNFVTARMYGTYLTVTVQPMSPDYMKIYAFVHSEPRKYDFGNETLMRPEKVAQFYRVLGGILGE